MTGRGRAAAGRRAESAGRADRGQTPVDYAIGIGAFLLAVAFVFAFVPNIFGPFTAEAGDRLTLADRSAERLAGDLLVEDPARPAVLNRTCTREFFEGDGSFPSGCRFDDDAGSLEAALGIAGVGRPSVNVTVGDDAGVASVDGVPLRAGESPPDGVDTVVSRRSVLLGDDHYRLVVRLW